MVVRRCYYCVQQKGDRRSPSRMSIRDLFCQSRRQSHLVPWSVQTNCLTEIFIDRALERAAWLDKQLESTGKVVGPLHGLPISLKDQICIKGLETIMGA
jgi:Asp-tRNA(Asn)/Glu-tRNA(Gln) amidotransferase A subunit family amidase